jgi:hypothetical protein
VIRFAYALLLVGMLSFVGVVVLSLLGANDYFSDKALPSGVALLLLGLSALATTIGAISWLTAWARSSRGSN